MTTMGVSERFACRATGQARSTQRTTARDQTPADPDAELRAWLRGFAKTHPRQGHRRAYHEVRAEGWAVNHKRVQRLWREEGLRVPQRRRRKPMKLCKQRTGLAIGVEVPLVSGAQHQLTL